MADPLFKNNTMNTIEDVLKKHIEIYNSQVSDYRKFLLSEKEIKMFSAAMTEYASLNRQGWTRVEDVKEVLEKCREYMDDRADADYENEMYQPNREAGLLVDIDIVLTKLDATTKQTNLKNKYMKETIYQMYSFESNEWVECDKQTFLQTEDKYRRTEDVYIEGFRQPNRFDLMSDAEKTIGFAIGEVEKVGASEHLTNAVIKLGQARDLVYEHYRTIYELDRISEPGKPSNL